MMQTAKHSNDIDNEVLALVSEHFFKKSTALMTKFF